MTYTMQLESYISKCEAALKQVCAAVLQPGSRVSEAAAYSLAGGGKRVRGTLTLAVCDMLGGNMPAAAQLAAAVEMVHAFSLVHDDLPCMDDDDMRRGKPSCHVAFGEDMALLAGDLLVLQAMEVAAAAPMNDKARADAVLVLTRAAGAKGMIYGQELDLAAEHRSITGEELREVHKHKTGALIRCAAQLGILAAAQDIDANPAVTIYADTIGLVFQIVDDILDVTSTAEELGKPIGSDVQQGKNTFVSMYGLEEARAKVQHSTDGAVKALQNAYGDKADFLVQFAQQLAQRAS